MFAINYLPGKHKFQKPFIYLIITAFCVYNFIANSPFQTPTYFQNNLRGISEITQSSRPLGLKNISPLCPPSPPHLVGKLVINKKVSLKEAEKNMTGIVQSGGSYSPPNCTARWNIAIIVCFRNREEQLGPFNNHIHRLLQKQQLAYTIYLVNQTDNEPFNRAKLFNVGYMESLKDGFYDCYIFHDVDFLPEDDRQLYHCSHMPRRMISIFDNKPFRNDYFGGVVMLTGKHMALVNGWSNSYWGWGGEDDDMKVRVTKQKLSIWTYPLHLGHYAMLPHKPAAKNPIRFKLLNQAGRRMSKDGLSSLRYKLVSKILQPLFTVINTNISEKS